MKKVLLSAAVVAGTVAVTTAGVGVASAANNTSGSLADRLASHFNLSKTEVQKVIDEEHQTRHAEREQAMKDRLAQAVKDGKLTQAQADQITAKMAEMQKQMDTLKDKTPQERHDAMKAYRDELKKWADENGISMQWLAMRGGHGHHGRAYIDGYQQ